VAETHFRCGVKGESDQDGRNRQANWRYFRVDGAKGQALTLDLVDLPGEYNYRPNRGAVTGETLPWYSVYSGKAWKCLTASGKSKVIASGAILPFTIKTIFRGQNQ